MPAKKKKGSKKGKKSKEPKPEEEKKPEDLEPEYVHPDSLLPDVEIQVCLASPPLGLTGKLLSVIITTDFKVTLKTNTRISTIRQMIIDKFDGSIRAEDISMCCDSYSSKKENWLDPSKQLRDVGITTASQVHKIVWEFVPISYPLLNTPLANIRAK